MNEILAKSCHLLAAEWSKKNHPLTSSDVTTGSNRRVWWKGACGHEWQATVKNRVNGSGCPYCSGHKLLKGFNDLASQKPELASEWSDRNKPLMPDMVMTRSNKKVWWKCIHGHEWASKIADRFYGSECPYCEGHLLKKGFNDFASRYPALAAEWSENNFPEKPDEVFPKSRQNVWWKCRVCGYEWQAVIYKRVCGQSCPACEDRAVKEGVNDLKTTDPEILAEWDYERNYQLTPAEISRQSLRPVWWKCAKGHRWRAKVADRVIDHEPCHICLRNFEKDFPDMLLRLYIKRAGYEVIIGEEDLIGIPVANYIPAKNAVIEISKPVFNTKYGYQMEYAKNVLLKKSRIKLIRILAKKDREFEDCVIIRRLDYSNEALADAIISALQILRIETDSNVKNDREYLLNKYLGGNDD